jgi:hypothetical protein
MGMAILLSPLPAHNANPPPSRGRVGRGGRRELGAGSGRHFSRRSRAAAPPPADFVGDLPREGGGFARGFAVPCGTMEQR